MFGTKRTENDVRAELMTITPEMAKAFLGANSNFRKINQRKVAAYARDMVAGSWHVNGESIKLDRNAGELKDGQHRLTACVKTGIPFKSIVVWVDTDMGVDRGMNRTVGQLFTHLGIKHANNVGAMVGVITRYKDGTLDATSSSPKTDDERLEAYQSLDAEELQTSVRLGSQMYASGLGSITCWGSAIYLMREIDEEDAAFFCESVRNGANLSANDPALILRNRLSSFQYAQAKSRSSIRAFVAMAFIAKAWNAYREKRAVTFLKFLQSEPFPQFK